MKQKANYRILARIVFLLLIPFFLLTCEEEGEDDPTPTKDLMQGVWEVTAAYDAADTSIMQSINFVLPTYLKFDDYNSINSTGGPMFMYVVYGGSKFIEITSKVDAAFDYLNHQWTQGEYGIADGVVDRFTLEIKLKFPGTQTITEVLDLFGIPTPQLGEPIIHHKFYNVGIVISDDDPNKMTLLFDDATTSEYNIKNNNLQYVLWTGLQDIPFTKCSFVLTKRTKTLDQLVDGTK
jgi:hypothetical protein